MSQRTEKLAKIDQWPNLRERMLGGVLLGALLIASLLLVTEPTEDSWETLPLAVLLGLVGGLGLTLALLFAGMTLRWQTLSRRLTLPLCALLIGAGIGTVAFCILCTDNAPRSPIGVAELQHAPAYFAGLAAAVFGLVNWPGRPKA